MTTAIATRTFPVIEIFGPTIQGEGALAGAPTLFVRFGGCDYRCSWCDSMYAVDPAEVREHAEHLSVAQITERLDKLVQTPTTEWGGWVTLSGGNPALMRFDSAENDLVGELRVSGYQVAVETQGSIWREWLAEVDHLTVSPKPPSSGMLNDAHASRTQAFLWTAEAALEPHSRSLKVVVFDEDDLAYAKRLLKACPGWEHFLSVGTDQIPHNDSAVIRQLCDRYAWLAERVAADPDLTGVRVYPQLHVLAWGTKRGV